MLSQESSILKRLRHIDFTILICTLILSSISVLVLYSIADEYIAPMYVVQGAATLLGIIMMLFISQIDYQDLCDKLTIPLFIFSILFLLATLLLGSEGDYGSKSWIKIPGIPVNIQPSEFVKLFLTITLAKHLSREKKSINHPLTLIKLGLHACPIIALVLMQGDLGTALVYMVMIIAMLFAAGLSLWYFLGIGVAVIIAMPYLWPHLGEYQQMRILCGFNPELDPEVYGFQALHAKNAIASGGLFGRGLFGGTSYKSVPMANSDSIFAIIGEKFGFVGCMVVFLTFIVLIVRIIWIAKSARKTYSGYICIGISAVLIAQFIENIGMNLAMLPVVGITLPFLSYGGSSVLSLYLMMGIIQSIYTHKQKYFFERELPE